MKSIVLGFVLWFMLVASGSAESSEKMAYRIVTFKPVVKDIISGNDQWKICGNYFAVIETTAGKIVHFNYELGLRKVDTVFAFYQIKQIAVKINNKLMVPVVVMRYEKIDIWMNARDYKIGLPCLANGTKI